MEKLIEFEFNLQAKPVCYGDNDFYALCNGYCNPEDILVGKNQAELVRTAQRVLQDFFRQATHMGLIEKM